MGALGHTPMPLLSVGSCHLCFFQFESHLLGVVFQCGYSIYAAMQSGCCSHSSTRVLSRDKLSAALLSVSAEHCDNVRLTNVLRLVHTCFRNRIICIPKQKLCILKQDKLYPETETLYPETETLYPETETLYPETA